LTSSDLYKQSLPFPHRRVTFVRATDINGTILMDDVPIIDGSVSASLTSTVTRTLDLRVSDDLFPVSPTDPLSPYQSVLHVSTGIGYPDGSFDVFPVFTGRVMEASRGAEGDVAIRCDDLAADVVAFRFEQPTISSAGASTVAQIQAFILQALPQATFGTNDVTDQAVPKLAWDDDRGKALDQLAVALQGRWYTLGNGDFVVRRYPYATSPALAFYLDGQPSVTLVPLTYNGVVSAATRTITRDGTANSITVVSDRLDGSGSIRYTERDTSGTSPTRFSGLYGKVSQILRPQTPVNNASAQALARQQLSSSRALTEQWSASIVPDATLEPGDTISLSYRGQSAAQVIDTITYPLTTGSLMTLGMRAQVDPIPEEL